MANFNKVEEIPTWNGLTTPKIHDRMKALFQSSKWHDCCFKLWKSDGTGEELIFAHTIILASSSPVFEALCFGPLAEKNTIEIPDVDPVAFRTMLCFIYTDGIDFDSVELACNVLYASKKYLIYALIHLAITYISCQINESNCLQIYEFAKFIKEEKLIVESWKYLCSHLDDVLDYFSSESLSLDLLKNLVNEEALNGGEFIIYKLCLMWAEFECENNSLDKTGENLRDVLIKADLLNKIRFLTFSSEEFKEGPLKSGILNSEEIQYISNAINFCVNVNENSDSSSTINKFTLKSDPESNSSKVPCLSIENSSINTSSPSNINTIVEGRKKIQLKKVYCHRFIEKEARSNLIPKDKLKIHTYITANKSVRLTALFVNAKILPFTQLNAGLAHFCPFIERNYTEKLFISICDSSDKTLFGTLFLEKVGYGTIFKIPLQTPVILERSKEYKIQIELIDSSENYLFGVRNSISKIPSGLCVTFKEMANIGDYGNFIEANDLSIISGLELCL